MSRLEKDTLGSYLKIAEGKEAARRCDPNLSLMCRLDGRAFHTFTRGLRRPYDTRLNELMVNTTKYLVEKTNAKLGYTQSDEISLFWETKTPEEEYIFGGKYQKIASITASLATMYFNKHLAELIPEKADETPIFDSRCWDVIPEDVIKNFVWRQNDAVKNSISMLAQGFISHTQLDGKNSIDKKQMLIELGRPWDLEPEFFKSGTFVKRVSEMITLSEEVLDKIPPQHRPTGPVRRSRIESFSPGHFKNITIEKWNELIDPNTSFETS